jgi:hypothetical protein
MITDLEWRNIQMVRKKWKHGFRIQREVQWMLDLLKREGGSMRKAELENARRDGYNVDGIKEKP